VILDSWRATRHMRYEDVQNAIGMKGESMAIAEERIVPGRIPEATDAEWSIIEQHVRYVERMEDGAIEYQTLFVVKHQSFPIGCLFSNTQEADWYSWMLAKALLAFREMP